MGARRAVGITRWKTAWLVKDTPLALLWMVGTTVVVYCLSWWGWFATEIGYNRQWADTHPADPGWGWVPDSVRSWWNYHAQILEFHTHLTSDHPYKIERAARSGYPRRLGEVSERSKERDWKSRTC